MNRGAPSEQSVRQAASASCESGCFYRGRIARLCPLAVGIRDGRNQLDNDFVGEGRSQCAVEQGGFNGSRPQSVGSNQTGAASHFLFVMRKRVDVYANATVDI